MVKKKKIEARTEIKEIFSLVFWKIEDTVISFWNFLTFNVFSSCLPSIPSIRLRVPKCSQSTWLSRRRATNSKLCIGAIQYGPKKWAYKSTLTLFSYWNQCMQWGAHRDVFCQLPFRWIYYCHCSRGWSPKFATKGHSLIT